MPHSVLTRGRKLVARLTALAMVASIMVIGALPASAAIDTSATCPASTPSAGFTDIGGFDATTQLAINCLADYDITKGTSATTFSPAGEVARWQMALFLTRQAAIHGVTLPSGAPQGFTDIGGQSAEAQIAINQLAQLDITKGTSATTFSPNDIVSRWQMALFLTRLVQAAGVTLPSGADQGFTDIGGLPAEYQTAINQLKQLGIADGTSATTYTPLSNTLRWQMALFLTRTLAADGITSGIGPNMTFTAAPELVSVEKSTGGVVYWNFDTAIPGQALNPADWRLYGTTGAFSTPSEASIDGQRVKTRFTTGPVTVASAVRAGVREGAVKTGTGLPNIAGDFALTASAVQVSPINPNLTSVGNYRFADDISLGVSYVLVDFVFADATPRTVPTIVDALNVVPRTLDTAFQLTGLNGQRWNALNAINAVYDISVAGQTTVTVAFATDPTDVPQGQLRRGAFTAAGIVWSANFGATAGATVDPDLVSVTREGTSNIFRFTFDEAVSDIALQILQTGFVLVDSGLATYTSDLATRLADVDARTIRARFPTLGANVPVHAFVVEAAVIATDSTDSDFGGLNRATSKPITIPVLADPPPGVTALPDLVSAQRFQNIVTGRFAIVLTFDQAFAPADIGLIDIVLYDSAGVAFAVNTAGAGITFPTTTTIRVSSLSNLTDDQIEATVTVAVQTTALAPPAIVTEGQVDARTLTQE